MTTRSGASYKHKEPDMADEAVVVEMIKCLKPSLKTDKNEIRNSRKKGRDEMRS